MRQSGIPQTISTSRSTLLVLTTIAMILLPGAASAQAKRYPLESAERLRFHNVTAEPAMLQGKKGLKATISEEARRRMSQTQQYAQGLVCIAFRVQEDLKTYDAFYLRPTNGRADDQERRNHSAQYISLPEWPWSRLRKETPSKYEAYVDLVPGTWTKIKIEVRGEQARLYVHDNEQPTLIVKDVKSGANGHGGVALWLEPGTVGHFRNLTVEPSTR